MLYLRVKTKTHSYIELYKRTQLSKIKAVDLIYFPFLFYFQFSFDSLFHFLFLELGLGLE